MIQQHISNCNRCNGTGKFIDIHNRCDKCNGDGLYKENMMYELKLEKEMLFNQKIKVSKIGNCVLAQQNNIIISDLIIVLDIDQTPDNNMEYRIYNKIHLYRKIKISLSDAILGFSKRIKYLDNDFITFKRNQITQPSSVYRLPNLGFLPNGNLYLKIIVHIPEDMPQSIIQQIAKVYCKNSNQSDNYNFNNNSSEKLNSDSSFNNSINNSNINMNSRKIIDKRIVDIDILEETNEINEHFN
jgi:DnaJ-class molecular chaperone